MNILSGYFQTGGKCGICKEEGHNRRGCPQNKDKSKTKPEPKKTSKRKKVRVKSKKTLPKLTAVAAPETTTTVPKSKPKKLVKVSKPKKTTKPKIVKTKKASKSTTTNKVLQESTASLKSSAPRRNFEPWTLPNRKSFTEWMNTTYSEPFDLSRNKKSREQFPHQEFVTNYIQKNSPYRGILLYHGLGAGKTASSVAITDGLSHDRKIVIMLPASLRTNYVNEIQRWGNILFKENVHYTFVPASRNSKTEQLLVERGIPLKWIRKVGKRSKSKAGAWMIDTKKRSRNKSLTEEENDEIRKQIETLLDEKYTILHYNNTNTLIQQIFEKVGGRRLKSKAPGANKRLTREELINLVHEATIVNPEDNPFNDKVLVVDEIHNLISMMIGGGFNGPQVYRLLMTARRVKYVFLSGTPLINYPYEVAILLNIIRGYTHTLQIPVRKGPGGEIIRNLETNLRKRVGGIDRVEYKRGKLYITRNARGFVSLWNLNQYKGVIGDPTHSQLSIEDLTSKIRTEISKNNWNVTDEITTIRNTVFPEIIEEALKLPDTKSGLINFKRGRDNAINRFESLFIRGADGIKNEDLFMRRILGLVSYYKRVNRSDWFPTTLNPDGSVWNAEESGRQVRVNMSGWQLEKYVEVRDIERERDSKNRLGNAKKALKAEIEEQSKKTSSLYRILSRQHCNFVFPPHIDRPRPNSKMILEDEELEDEGELVEYTELLKDAIDGLCRVHLMTDANPLRKLLIAHMKKSIEGFGEFSKCNQIVSTLEHGLDELSPKFVAMLRNMNEAPGLSFLYSQFRSVEGIEVFSKVLDANGYSKYTDDDISSIGLYDMVEVVLEKSKKTFHTGMIIKKRYTNTDKPYYKKLAEAIVEMETMNRMDEFTIEELHKCKKICDPSRIVKGLKYRVKNSVKKLWESVREEMTEIPDEKTFKADYKAITEGECSYCVRSTHSDTERWFTAEDLTRSRYALWTGTEDPEVREVIRGRFNLSENKMGNIIKILMITSSGAEGISLMNVRGVHIMEPYWNRVRIEQVIGRAARIKSHVELDKRSQNVTVFEYIVGLTAAQKRLPIASNVLTKDMGFTSDEVLYQISDVKSRVLYGLLKLLKRSAIDCQFNDMDNRASGDDHECYRFLEGDEGEYANTINIMADQRDETRARRITKRVEKYATVEFTTRAKVKGKRIPVKYLIRLEKGDEGLNPLEIDAVRIIYNYYTRDKTPIGFVYKGKHRFIKRKFMVDFDNGKFDRKDFLKGKVKQMCLSKEEEKTLILPWVKAEITASKK